MITVLTTECFDSWIKNLRDIRAKTKILMRIRRLKNGIMVMFNPLVMAFRN
ncbi:putative addiction module killer protein [Providencia rettgeri DSM 1131]|nr:putative addiction module killer protein [Providencia rettgeri DSM 1131]